MAGAPLGTLSFFKYFAKEMGTEVQNNFTFPHTTSYSLNCCNSHDRDMVRAVFSAVMRPVGTEAVGNLGCFGTLLII